MSRTLRRAVTELALRLGYVPIDQSWATDLRTIEGEFRRSAKEYFVALLGAALWMVAAALTLGIAYGLYRDDPSGRSFYVLLVLATLAVAVSALLIKRAGTTYVFERGRLSALASSGRLLWREDLAGVIGINCANWWGDLWLTLRWRDHKRQLQCYQALAQVLLRRGSAPNNALEQTREG